MQLRVSGTVEDPQIVTPDGQAVLPAVEQPSAPVRPAARAVRSVSQSDPVEAESVSD